jgi:hypothetical protein
VSAPVRPCVTFVTEIGSAQVGCFQAVVRWECQFALYSRVGPRSGCRNSLPALGACTNGKQPEREADPQVENAYTLTGKSLFYTG